MIEYKYSKDKNLQELLTAYKYLTQQISPSLFAESLRIVTSQLDEVFIQVKNLRTFVDLITEIVEEDASLSKLMGLIEKLELSEDKSSTTFSSPVTQSDLITKFSLVTTTKKELVQNAVQVLYYFFIGDQQGIAKYLQSCLSGTEPGQQENQQEIILTQLISEMKPIIKTHINSVANEINLLIYNKN